MPSSPIASRRGKLVFPVDAGDADETGRLMPLFPSGLEKRLDAGLLQRNHHQIEAIATEQQLRAETIADDLQLATLPFRAQRGLEQSNGFGIVLEHQDRGAARCPALNHADQFEAPRHVRHE